MMGKPERIRIARGLRRSPARFDSTPGSSTSSRARFDEPSIAVIAEGFVVGLGDYEGTVEHRSAGRVRLARISSTATCTSSPRCSCRTSSPAPSCPRERRRSSPIPHEIAQRLRRERRRVHDRRRHARRRSTCLLDDSVLRPGDAV
ncbi:MAG: hypothetical protein MZU97_20700 [Bacillus subtilis]|nr:hypothetical protein [Bacillus subtilis]